MKAKLSALFYIKNNKKRISVLVVSIGLFITMLYGTGFLFSVTYASFGNIMIEKQQKCQMLLAQEKVTENQLLDACEKIKTLPNVDDAFSVLCGNAYINSIIGEYGFENPLTTKENIVKYMDYMGAELVAGKIPENKGEIIYDEKYRKNLGLKLNQQLSEEFKLVGLVKSDYYFCCGINPYDYESSITILSDGKDVDYNKILSDMDIGFKFKVIDHVTGKKDYNHAVVEAFEPSTNVLTVVSTLILILCLIIVINMYIRDRHEEWCLYHSIGFSTQNIYLCALKEFLLIFLFAICFSIVTTLIVMFSLDVLLVKSKGLLAYYFMSDKIYQIFSILVLLFGIFQIPIFHAMRKIRTIDAMEDDTF